MLQSYICLHWVLCYKNLKRQGNIDSKTKKSVNKHDGQHQHKTEDFFF